MLEFFVQNPRGIGFSLPFQPNLFCLCRRPNALGLHIAVGPNLRGPFLALKPIIGRLPPPIFLTTRPDLVGQGIANGVLRFLSLELGARTDLG